jgi:hypothetical protein
VGPLLSARRTRGLHSDAAAQLNRALCGFWEYVISLGAKGVQLARIAISIAGHLESADPQLNPFVALSSDRVQRTLRALAERPCHLSNLEAGVLSDLVRIDAVRVDNGLCHINFPCLLLADLEAIENASLGPARDLADTVLKQAHDFRLIASRTQHAHVGTEKTLYFLLGCFGLDWFGLRLLGEQGLLSYLPQKPGGRYVLYGQETGAGSCLVKLNSSNNSAMGDFAFTSFGNGGVRRCFPELFWALRESGVSSFDDDLRHKLTQAFNLADDTESWARQVTDSLLARCRIDGVAALLEHLSYTQNGRLNVPVFVEQDQECLVAVRELLRDILASWARKHYNGIRTELVSISPSRNGVDFAETFSLVWHSVFGMSNAILATEGLIYNPQRPESPFMGYLPAVHSRRVRM